MRIYTYIYIYILMYACICFYIYIYSFIPVSSLGYLTVVVKVTVKRD